MTHHIGQQVELRVACGPFVRGQVVTIQAIEATATPGFLLTCCGHRTTATAEDFGAVQRELPTTEELDMTRKNGADLSANMAAPAGDGEIDPSSTVADNTTTAYPVGQVVRLPLDLLDPDPDNERTDLGDLTALAASMAVAQEEPIQVYRQANGRYMNKTGHRRSAAARVLGWPTIAALIVVPPTDARRRHLGRIVSNLLREDPNIIMLAARLRDTLAEGEVDQTELARQLGKSQSWISNTMRLLNLPEPVRALISSGKLTAGHGVQLLRITEPELTDWEGSPTGQSAAAEQAYFAQHASSGEWSVSTLMNTVDSYLKRQENAKYQAAQRERIQQAAEAAKVAAAEARARGGDPQAAARAAQAAVEAAEQAKAQAAKDRETARRAERGGVAAAVVDRIIGYTPGSAPSLDHLRLLGRMALTATGRFGNASGPEPDRLLRELEAAPDECSLLVVLGAIARAGLPLDVEERAVYGNYYVTGWADGRWFLNVQIADELLRRGLILKVSHQKLREGKPQPPPPAAPPQPSSEVQCPNCASDFVPVAGDTMQIVGSGPELRCPFCANEFTPSLRAAAA